MEEVGGGGIGDFLHDVFGRVREFDGGGVTGDDLG